MGEVTKWFIIDVLGGRLIRVDPYNFRLGRYDMIAKYELRSDDFIYKTIIDGEWWAIGNHSPAMKLWLCEDK